MNKTEACFGIDGVKANIDSLTNDFERMQDMARDLPPLPLSKYHRDKFLTKLKELELKVLSHSEHMKRMRESLQEFYKAYDNES